MARPASATLVGISGFTSFEVNTSFTQLTIFVDSIDNVDLFFNSGTLKLEFWVFPDGPYVGLLTLFQKNGHPLSYAAQALAA